MTIVRQVERKRPRRYDYYDIDPNDPQSDTEPFGSIDYKGKRWHVSYRHATWEEWRYLGDTKGYPTIVAAEAALMKYRDEYVRTNKT